VDPAETKSPLSWAFADAIALCETRWTARPGFTHQRLHARDLWPAFADTSRHARPAGENVDTTARLGTDLGKTPGNPWHRCGPMVVALIVSWPACG